MTADQVVLQDLLRRVESATGADRGLDEAILLACCYAPDVRVSDIDGHVWERWTTPDGEVQHQQRPALTASLDAALALVERVLGVTAGDDDDGSLGGVIAGNYYGKANATTWGNPPSYRYAKGFASISLLDGPMSNFRGHAETPALALLAALLKALAAGQSLTGKSVDGSTPQTPESPQ